MDSWKFIINQVKIREKFYRNTIMEIFLPPHIYIPSESSDCFLMK